MLHFRRAMWIVAALVSAACLNLCAAENPALKLAFAADDLDFSACTVFRNGSELPRDPDHKGIVGSLGFGRDPSRWTGGSGAAENETVKLQFVVALKQPIAMGSVAYHDNCEIFYAKDAAGADPLKQEQWAAPQTSVQSGRGRMAVFPPEFKGKLFQIRMTCKHRDPVALEFVRFYAHRLGNILVAGTVNADSEYTQTSKLGPPQFCLATNVIEGKGRWQNTGVTGSNDKIHRAPISETAPSWFVISWDKPQAVDALYMEDDFKKVEFFTYTGPDGINPAVEAASEWSPIRNAQEVRLSALGRQLVFPETLTTRGIKMLITATQFPAPPQVATLTGLHVYADIGNGPLPALEADADAPKFTVPYSMPEDGTVTLVVSDNTGKRVRTIASRTPRTAGEHKEAWDLTDDAGNLVPPGSYKFTALTLPKLEQIYQMTATPNIETHHPENTPWLNGASGSGGWLADHSPPRCACAYGDRVYIGAQCAESGVALIECDLTGKKMWGCSNLGAWTGPSYLACDGTSLFSGAPPNASNPVDNIWRIDLKTKKVETFLDQASDSKRMRGLRGLATHDGKLFASIWATEDWLQGAATASDVDVTHCIPLYPAYKKSNDYNEPDPRGDFLRLFRLTGTPSGHGSAGLIELQTTPSNAFEQHIVLAFNNPVPLGSVMLPVPDPATDKSGYLHLSVLKPGAPYPPRPNNAADWTPFAESEDHGWTVFAAPKNTLTRALRISFSKDKDALNAGLSADNDVDLNDISAAKKSSTGDAPAGKNWQARLEGAKLLRRRFETLASKAKVSVNSGSLNAQGEWDAQRTTPISKDDPGIYAMEWSAPQAIRGLAIKEIDGARTEIDVFEGPADAKIDIQSGAGWRNVASYTQKQRYFYQPGLDYNGRARYIDGYVDFGEEVTTRAIRLRIVEQWTARLEGRLALQGVRIDRGGMTLDPTRCHVYGVAPLHYLGGEVPTDPLAAERLEVYDIASRKLVKERALQKAGPIAIGPDGALYGLCGGAIIKVNPDAAEQDEPIAIADLKKPIAFAIDAAGKFYIFDAEPDRENVRVYDASGKFERTIGGAGGCKMGPYDPNFLSTPPGTSVDLAVDKENQLWVVQCLFAPKRVTVFSTTDGALKRDFLGNTAYGGGGVLDPTDKRRLFFAYGDNTMEFEINWENGATRLKNMAWIGDSAGGELPVKIEDRTYLVTRPSFGRQRYATVYLYDKDHLRRVAAMGLADAFKPLQKDPAIAKSLGKKALADMQFIWTDKNGDGEVQLDEVTFAPKTIGSVGYFDNTLGLQAGALRYEVQSFLPNGAPVYDAKPCAWTDVRNCIRLPNGNFFGLGAQADTIFGPDGKTLFSYNTEGIGVQAITTAKPFYDGQVVAEFDVVGVETAKSGDLGTFLVTSNNVGSWNIWTSDGLLAGRLFSDLRITRNPWSMPWTEGAPKGQGRGLHLENVTIGQEHFAGAFCQTSDGHCYAVAGHNHVSVVEVTGLDRAHRSSGSLEVSAKDIEEALKAAGRRSARETQKRARMMTCVRASGPITPDGNLDDWRSINPVSLDNDDVQFRMAYNDNFLFVSFETRKQGPLANHGTEFRRLFKTGAAVDLQMGTDPAADSLRASPVRGDFRLLMTVVDGKPVAVLYSPVYPGAGKDEGKEFRTTVAQASFDRIVQLNNVRIGTTLNDDDYILEAAIPLEAIGLKPKPGMRLKADFGILLGGKSGTETIQRSYWSNKATQMISDEPTEAKLQPNQWGFVTFDDGGSSAPAHGQQNNDATENLLNDLGK